MGLKSIRFFAGMAATVLLLSAAIYGQHIKPDPSIIAMSKEVSAKNIEATVRKLVSFGTRNTLSSQTDPKRGVGAARDWIYGEFQRISAGCGGCLNGRETDLHSAKGDPRSAAC